MQMWESEVERERVEQIVRAPLPKLPPRRDSKLGQQRLEALKREQGRRKANVRRRR